MPSIAIHGSHNASIVLEKDGVILEVIEIERYLNNKNIGITQYLTASCRHFIVQNVLKYIEKKYGIKEYDKVFCSNTDVVEDREIRWVSNYIPTKETINLFHHESHAYNSLYLSDHQEALIVSFDGGGSDGFFNVYYGNKDKGIEELKRYDLDLGFAYMIFGEYVKDIKKEYDLARGNLVYAGKLMGLSSYGKVVDEWLKPLKDFYRSRVSGNDFRYKVGRLGEQIGIQFDREKQLEGQIAWDLVATSQRAFEEVFYETVTPHLEEHPNIPLHLAGGCSLNILLNTRLKNELKRDVFIAPNGSDCGLAVGMMLRYLRPKKPLDITYAGIEILDQDTLMEYVETFYARPTNFEDIVSDLVDGKVIGVVKDRAEHGPRALGNRSIICNPTIKDMKDTLNFKVKNREWYRPFAPVVRLEDVSTYFEFEGESRWMSFCPKVREEWREKLPSITHVDNTARVQTVTREQNPWLYDLITKFKEVTGVGVLLNTSFNIAGKPIVSTYRDAIKLYNNSQMDRLLLQDFYFKNKVGQW